MKNRRRLLLNIGVALALSSFSAISSAGIEYDPQHQFDRCQEILDKLKSHYYFRLNKSPRALEPAPDSYQTLCEGKIPYPFEPDDSFVDLAKKIVSQHDQVVALQDKKRLESSQAQFEALQEAIGSQIAQSAEVEALFLKICNRSTEKEIERSLDLARLTYRIFEHKEIRRGDDRKVDLGPLPLVRDELARLRLNLVDLYGDGQFDELIQPAKKIHPGAAEAAPEDDEDESSDKTAQIDQHLAKAVKTGFDAFVASNASGNTLYVATTGTEEYWDMQSDFSLGRGQIESVEAERMLKDILNKVLERSARGEFTKLIFTGHSLGGINAVLAHELEERLKLQVQAGQLDARNVLYSIDTVGFNSIGPKTVMDQIQQSYPKQRHPTSLSLYGITPITVSTKEDMVIQSGGQYDVDNFEVKVPKDYKPVDYKNYPAAIWQHSSQVIVDTMLDQSVPVDDSGFHKLKQMHRKVIDTYSAPKMISSFLNMYNGKNDRAPKICEKIKGLFKEKFSDDAFIAPDGEGHCLDKFSRR